MDKQHGRMWGNNYWSSHNFGHKNQEVKTNRRLHANHSKAKEKFVINKIAPAAYKTFVCQLLKKFKEVIMEHIEKHYKCTNVLPTLGTKAELMKSLTQSQS